MTGNRLKLIIVNIPYKIPYQVDFVAPCSNYYIIPYIFLIYSLLNPYKNPRCVADLYAESAPALACLREALAPAWVRAVLAQSHSKGQLCNGPRIGDRSERI